MVFQGLDLARLEDSNVLFWIRIRGKESYFNSVYSKSLLARFERLRQFRTISEYPRDADVHIDLKKYGVSDLSQDDLALVRRCLPAFEIVQRCRGLRSIAYTEAKSLMLRAAKFFIELMKDGQLKLIVMGAVDNYVMDIMVRLARHYGIATLGVTEFFLAPDFKLVTVMGEHNHFREPSEEQVGAIHELLVKRAKSVLAVSKSRAVKQAAWDYLSYRYRYVVRYLLQHKLMGKEGYEYRFAPFFAKFTSLSQLAGIQYLQGEERLLASDLSRAVYIPLHYVPEATVDYWVEDPDDADYLASLAKVVGHYSERGHLVVIKEHPAFYLARSPDFYRALLKFPNVLLLKPFITSKLIFQHVKQVVVWTGSTGVEALVQGLDVKVVTENYYSDGKLAHYTEQRESRFDQAQQRELVRRVLQTSLEV